jgi:hypothetical protein
VDDVSYKSHQAPTAPHIAATLRRTASIRKTMITIRETTINELRFLLKNELSAGRTLTKHALRCSNPKIASREPALARQAYDAIMRLRRTTIPDIQTEGFAAELDN